MVSLEYGPGRGSTEPKRLGLLVECAGSVETRASPSSLILRACCAFTSLSFLLEGSHAVSRCHSESSVALLSGSIDGTITAVPFLCKFCPQRLNTYLATGISEIAFFLNRLRGFPIKDEWGDETHKT